MLLTNRRFKREPPSRTAKSIYIFCEGLKREYEYFRYFVEMDSRINLEIYKLHPHENNSPSGLLEIAKSCILSAEDGEIPKYNFLENDEVWIVIDVDKDKSESRKPQIKKIKAFCNNQIDWHILQSNPCFEVWLFYHLLNEHNNFEGIEKCKNWKIKLNKSIKGGFDSRRHPIFIEKAMKAARLNFNSSEIEPEIGSSELFKLAESMLTVLKMKIDKVLEELK